MAAFIATLLLAGFAISATWLAVFCPDQKVPS